MPAETQLPLSAVNAQGFLLLSIRREHLDRILAGSKRFELRKALPKAPFSHVFLHLTGGAGLVAAFEVQRVVHDGVDSLLHVVGEDGTTRERLKSYFKGFSRGYAIEVRRVLPLPRAVAAKEVRAVVGAFKAPQGFRYVPSGTPLYRMLALLLRGKEHEQATTMRLRPISEAERALFTAAVKESIIPNYGGIDEGFAEALLATHDLDCDPEGLFTERKEVLAATLAESGELVGFTTLTTKVGGSVKSGPTILFEKFRGRGLGQALRRAIERRVLASGMRKIYCTAPDSVLPAVGYLLRAGYRVEAHLAAHYSADHGELVFGKILREHLRARLPVRRSLAATASRLEPADSAVIRPHVRAISELFQLHWFPSTPSVAATVARRSVQRMHSPRKPRRILRLTSGDRCTAVAVLATKNGGATKAVVALGTSHTSSVQALVDAIEDEARRDRQRKLYFLHPVAERVLIDLLRNRRYLLEGILSAPYEVGNDLMVLSRFFV